MPQKSIGMKFGDSLTLCLPIEQSAILLDNVLIVFDIQYAAFLSQT
jgi:hypothetical protein